MNKLVSLVFVAALLILSGCAATVQKSADASTIHSTGHIKEVALLITGPSSIQSSADWQTFRAEWRTAFAAAASERNIHSIYLEHAPERLPAGTVLVSVFVNDYRYITPGARFGFGIMTGNAFIDANADFVEFPSAKKIGSQKFSTSSSAWQGVFSAMTDKQVRAISDDILTELAGA